MELYLTILVSVLSVGGFISICSGYNFYKTIQQSEKEIEILKSVIVEYVNSDTRDRSGHQV